MSGWKWDFLFVAAFVLATFIGIGEGFGDEDESAETEVEKLRVEPYGFGRLDAVGQSQDMNHPQYSMWVEPERESGQGVGDLTIHARLTRVGLRVPPTRLGESMEVSAKVEADFQNGGSESRPIPRLRHGYGRLFSGDFTLLLGQTWDLMSPLYPSVHADALMWNAGNLGDRRPQARIGWTPSFGDNELRVVAAVGMTGAVDGQDLDGGGVLDGLDAGVPMSQGLAEFELDGWTEDPVVVGASGHFGLEAAAFDDGGDPDGGAAYGGEKWFRSWSVSGHLELPLTSWVALRGEAFYGANLEDVRGGIGQSINEVDGSEIRARGGWAEAAFEPVDTYSFAVGASIDAPIEADLPEADRELGARTLNRTLYVGQTFRPWEPVKFGLEYWYWSTTHQQHGEETAHRVNFHGSLIF